jgi:hypothetical protein
MMIDLFREPESKDDLGWRGPGVLLKVMPDNSKAIVEWNGYPYLLPMRFLRPHIGLV